MQSICLISAYLAGANKEKIDSKIFTRRHDKVRKNNKPVDLKT
jgi:hypothetical protein